MFLDRNSTIALPSSDAVARPSGRKRGGLRWASIALVLLIAPHAWAQPSTSGVMPPLNTAAETAAGNTGGADPVFIPDLSQWMPRAVDKDSLSASLQILILLTMLTVAPSILLMMTSFVRMMIVLVLLRQALGTQQLPPSQVLVGLALFMTILVMAPTWQQVHADAVQPYLDGDLNQLDAISITSGHLRDFMFDQIETTGNEQDVYMMVEYARQEPIPATESLRRSDVSMTALVPAFLLSELKTSFILGFRVYLPFLVIDMVIATVLVSMGMMMLPPVLISLPFKLLLFVLADGWHLIGGSLMASVQ